MAVSTDQSSSLRAPEQSPGASTTVAPDLAKSAAGVSLRSVTKKYGAVTAIKDINLEIPAGVYCCLLGPSGCGKTTALRVISGHETVTSGQVLIGDRRSMTCPRLSATRR